MSDRTVTVHTGDRGRVAVPEPAWCVEDHARGEAYREDITHTAEVAYMEAPTPCHGTVYLVPFGWTLRPFYSDPLPRLSVDLDEWHDLTPDAVDALAVAFEAHATVLRGKAEELRTMRAES